MKHLLAYFCVLTVLAQSTVCVPISVGDESEVEPKKRGLLDSILAALSQAIVNGLASIGDESNIEENLFNSLMAVLTLNPAVIQNSDPAQASVGVNSEASTGDESNLEEKIFEKLMSALTSNPEVLQNLELDSQHMIIPADDQMLDVLNALVDQTILDQPIGTTETIENGEKVSLDEIGKDPLAPLLLVLFP